MSTAPGCGHTSNDPTPWLQAMLRIPCPHCGERDYTEFRYGGDATKVRPAHGSGDLKTWHDHVFLFDNPKGAPSRVLAARARLPAVARARAGYGDQYGRSLLARARQKRERGFAWLADLIASGPGAGSTVAVRSHSRSRVDGCRGFGGDTLASALLAQGVTLLGRSFKYHRPRGLLAAGVEEPNGLVTLGEGGGRTPNVPATTTELHEGIVACRQNGWPSVERRFDGGLDRVRDAPLLGAGFYYKTFMGPRRGSWMLYEPFIRRAAGLGRAYAHAGSGSIRDSPRVHRRARDRRRPRRPRGGAAPPPRRVRA